jgi:hypothetical protein
MCSCYYSSPFNYQQAGQTGWLQFLHRQLSLPMQQYSNFTCIWCLYLAADSVCKSLFDIRSVFSSRQSTDKQVDGRGVSTVSFTGSFLHILRSNLPIQSSFGSNAVWCVSYQSLSRSWYTNVDYGLHRLPEPELGLMAGVTGRQEMPTPPRHLIPPLVYLEVCVCPILKFVFPMRLLGLMTVLYAISCVLYGLFYVCMFTYKRRWIQNDSCLLLGICFYRDISILHILLSLCELNNFSM